MHFTAGGHSGFEQLPLRTRVQLTRRAVQWGCHFLLRGKKWRKKRAKGPNALWIPAVRLCGRASAQHDAKGCIFSFCECDLKKVALTKVARTLLLQTAPALASFPVIDGSSNRTGKQKFLPSQPILGVRLCAQDGGGLPRYSLPAVLRQNGGRRGRPRRDRPGWQCLRPREARCSRSANKQTCDFGLPKSVFFRTFFVQRQRKYIYAAQRTRVAVCARRRSREKFRQPHPPPLPHCQKSINFHPKKQQKQHNDD